MLIFKNEANFFCLNSLEPPQKSAIILQNPERASPGLPMIQGGAWIPKHPGRACGGPWRSHRGRLSQRQRAALKTLDSGRPKRLKHRHLFFEWPTLPTPNNEKQQHFQIFHKSDFQDAPGFQGIQPFFFLMSQQCLNENFQECCNMFRCSGSRPTFDI